MPRTKFFDPACERLSLVYSNIPIALIGSFATACILVMLLKTAVQTAELISWLGAGALITYARYLNYRRFCRAQESLDAKAWRARFEIGTTASGLFWAYAAAGLFPSGDFVHQVFIGFVLAGLSASAMTTYAGMPRAYFLFVLPPILSFVVRMAVEGGSTHYSMAALTGLYLIAVIHSAVKTDRMFSNVLQGAELASTILHRATHDPLVDLVNRCEFNDRLITAANLAAKQRAPYAVLFIDLDRFKEINDTAGHAAGDETLRQVAEILKGQIRQDDTAARLGGDEFAILLAGCTRERAEQVAANILEEVKKFSLTWKGRSYRLGASVGVAYTNAGEHDADVILRAADRACYAAKNNGRGRVEVCYPDPLYQASGRFHTSQLAR